LHAGHWKSLKRSILTAAVTGPMARVDFVCAAGELVRRAASRRAGAKSFMKHSNLRQSWLSQTKN
jgi:hypothetical protein